MSDSTRIDILIQRVGDEVWLQFYKPGLRLRFEQTREEITDLVAICQGLLQTWDADTRAIAEKRGELLKEKPAE